MSDNAGMKHIHLTANGIDKIKSPFVNLDIQIIYILVELLTGKY